MNHLILAVLTVWMWTTPDGVTHYTDDAKRIPQAYQEQAERIEVGAFRDYPRLSIVEPVPAEKPEAPIHMDGPVIILGIPKE